MIYIILLIVSAFLVITNVMMHKKEKMFFTIMSIVMTVLAVFRYGVGSDYFAYRMYYNQSSNNLIEAMGNTTSHMNIGYRIIVSVIKRIGINSDMYFLIIALIMIIGFIYIIYNNSEVPLLSLFVFYSIYYQIYINSAIRQGIALLIFLYAFYRFFKNKKYLKYIIAILIAGTIHESVLITLLFPLIFVLYKRYFTNIYVNIIFIITALGMFAIKIDRILISLAKTLGIIIPYESSGANILAIILRIISIGFIYIIYKSCKNEELDDFEKFQIYSYFIGVLIFIAISNVPLFSRFTEYFSILEIILYANLINKIRLKYIKIFAVQFCVLMLSVVCIKDINSFTYQGDYYKKGSISYPYVTIFNKKDILKYRNIQEAYLPPELKDVTNN